MLQDILALLLSTALGSVVGWQRHVGRKPAGLRTHTLVCLGSTLFVLLTRYAVMNIGGPTLDPTRVIHGVITGVGFLGAGSIIRQGAYVQGLTTAASVWMVAAIGVAVGVHAYWLATIATALALIVLELFRALERRFSPRRGDEEDE